MRALLLSSLIAHSIAQLISIDKNAWLSEHNARRASEGGADMQKMIWSEQLQELAEDWAVRCKSPSTQPTPNRPVDQQTTELYEETGENMYWSSGEASPSDALDSWYTNEKALWNFPQNECTENWKACAHYTQVVWSRTCAVGCAQAKCSSGSAFDHVVVCNYGPAGNRVTNNDVSNPVFEQIYSAGTACSECTSGCSSDGELCNPQCVADPTTTTTTEEPTTTTSSSSGGGPDSDSDKPSSGSSSGNGDSTSGSGGKTRGSSSSSKTRRKPSPTSNVKIPPLGKETLPAHMLWPLNPNGPIGAGSLPAGFLDKLRGGAGSGSGSSSTNANCRDSNTLCEFWAGVDECMKNPVWMLSNCRRSCDQCDGSGRSGSSGTGTLGSGGLGITGTGSEGGDSINGGRFGCPNMHNLCIFWASVGECTNNALWMLRNCQAACDSCQGGSGFSSGSGTGFGSSSGSSSGGTSSLGTDESLGSITIGTLGSGVGTDGSASENNSDRENTGSCTDNRPECTDWALSGECEKNPYWMLPNCRRACKTCSDALSELTATQVECGNNNALCRFWASEGECERNAKYMHANCREACQMC